MTGAIALTGNKDDKVKTRIWAQVLAITVSALLFVGFAIVVGTTLGSVLA